MGDLEPWPVQSNGHLPEPNPEGLLHQYPPNPDPTTIDEATWQQAEASAQEVIRQIHPTVTSEKSRKVVIDYVNSIVTSIGAVASPFGSVPLKTYLPDGDIDLTALAEPNSEDLLPNDVRMVLQMAERSPFAIFEVKDVQLICGAEVKLVKCLVQNIVVDISFNQVGGLYTLCFLEEVDVLIGKDHLFKRSIMLIKSWCYYESRILGAYHGLISTYALETLILYIFHLFHKTLHSPLAVLYRFLDYYSKFDWENQGISVHGPISLASLPEIVAEAPEVPASDLLIQEDFANQCLERYQVKIPNRPNDARGFFRKNLNIVDPLKPTNNLGRSVSRGNFYRIRSAFVFGARKLSQILSLPVDSIPDEVSTFFRNTLERHGSSGPRPDVPEQTSTSPYADIDSSFAQMSVQYPNGLIPHNRPFGNPQHLAQPMFVRDQNFNGSGGCEHDSSDASSASPSNEPSEPDTFADITGNSKENERNLLYALNLFENKQPDTFVLPEQPAGLDASPVSPIPYRPFIGGRFGRRGMNGYMGANGVVTGPPFPAGPVGYYIMRPPMIPSGSHYVADESTKTRGTGTYLPLSHQRQQHHQQQQYRDRLYPRGKSRNLARQDQAGTMNELGPDEEPIFDSPSTSVYQPPPPPPLNFPYRVHNGQRVLHSPGMDIPQSHQLSIRGNGAGSSGPVFPQEQQVEFGSLGSVVLPTHGPNYAVGLRAPPPPPPLPPVPAVVQNGQRSSSAGPLIGNRSSMASNRSKRNNQAYRLKDEGDFPPLSG